MAMVGDSIPSRPSGGGSSSGHLSVSSGTAGAPGGRDVAPAVAAENLCLFCWTSGRSRTRNGRQAAAVEEWAHAVRVRCDSPTYKSKRCGDSHVMLGRVRSAALDARRRGIARKLQTYWTTMF